LKPGVDVEQEAATLFWRTHGLVGPLVVGLNTPEQAQILLDHHQDHIFK
jgi:TetR/AcrR family transcriptional regulator, transcriptional repressor of bet genes